VQIAREGAEAGWRGKDRTKRHHSRVRKLKCVHEDNGGDW